MLKLNLIFKVEDLRYRVNYDFKYFALPRCILDVDQVGSVLTSAPSNAAAYLSGGPYLISSSVPQDGLLFAFRTDFYSTQAVTVQVCMYLAGPYIYMYLLDPY